MDFEINETVIYIQFQSVKHFKLRLSPLLKKESIFKAFKCSHGKI